MIKEIPIKDILIDPSMQHREIDADVMKKYAGLMKDDVKFPPVSIVTDGTNYYLWDGAHRVAAHRKNGKTYISCNIENGTRRDAIYFSFSANKENAFPRQPGTAKGIIEKLLKDEEWSKISQREIARHVGVTEGFVRKVKNESKAHVRTSTQIEADSKPKNKVSRSKTVNVKRGESEYEAKVPEKKTLDSTGLQVPEHLVKYFERANEYRQLIRQVHAVYKICKDGKESGDLFYKYIDVSHLTAAFNTVKHNLKFAMPFAVCRYCMADEKNAECRACGGSGFVNEGMWKNTPREFK